MAAWKTSRSEIITAQVFTWYDMIAEWLRLGSRTGSQKRAHTRYGAALSNDASIPKTSGIPPMEDVVSTLILAGPHRSSHSSKIWGKLPQECPSSESTMTRAIGNRTANGPQTQSRKRICAPCGSLRLMAVRNLKLIGHESWVSTKLLYWADSNEECQNTTLSMFHSFVGTGR